MNSIVSERPLDAHTAWGPELGLSSGPRVAQQRKAAGRAGHVRRFLAFVGPGYLIAVGYMDPGNWATSLTGGSTFGYSLLSVILLSSIMAMFLQAASLRLGVAADLDLAQACRAHLSKPAGVGLWIACEIAIVACNLAEVLGMACGLQLLLHIPLLWGVIMTSADVMLILQLQKKGARHLEIFVIGLTVLVGACLALQLWWLRPSVQMFGGFIPTADIVTQPGMLYVAVAIMGATVMPHNLYLHSAIVRAHPAGIRDAASVRATIRYATLDSNIALGLAMIVNIAILVLAAGLFHQPGMTPVTELADAYRLLSPLLGVNGASAVFGLGLVAAGLSSSITGTLAGQVVMQGFLDVKVSRARRALLGRLLALVPAVLVAMLIGEGGVGRALVMTQVVLGLQLPFAIVPLLWFTTRRRFLGPHAFTRPAAVVLWGIAAVVIGGNCWMIYSLV